jgi:uncharacterized protein
MRPFFVGRQMRPLAPSADRRRAGSARGFCFITRNARRRTSLPPRQRVRSHPCAAAGCGPDLRDARRRSRASTCDPSRTRRSVRTQCARNDSPVHTQWPRTTESAQEELEAVGRHHRRAVVAQDDRLRRSLEHHRDEEIEHALLGPGQLRRVSPVFDEHMRTRRFNGADILEIEESDRRED